MKKTLISLCVFLISIASIADIADDFKKKPRLLVYPGPPSPEVCRPATLRDRIGFLDFQRPFDGVILYTGMGFEIMKNTPISYSTIYNELLPCKDLNATNCRYSLPMVYMQKTADYFDDWSVSIQNWANLAKACKDVGLPGICFDNEQYFGTNFAYPGDCKYAGTKTLKQYQDQALLRGKQIMEAIVAQYPNINMVACFHGPYLAEPKGPPYPVIYRLTLFNLIGSFALGFLEGRGNGGATVIEGGETGFGLVAYKDFKECYDWRKTGIASDQTNCAFIPVAMRPDWKNWSISYGLYDRGDVWTDAYNNATRQQQSISTMTLAVENSMRTCDHMVWLYCEGMTFIRQGVNDNWCAAIAEGKTKGLQARKQIYFNCETQTCVPAGQTLNFQATYVNTTTNTASLTYIKKPSWITANNNNTAISGTAPATARYDTLVAIASAGTNADTLTLDITVAAYLRFEAESAEKMGGAITAPMLIGDDAQASAGKYIYTPAGTGDTYYPADDATYYVNIPIAGIYYVWLSLFTSNIAKNGVMCEFDNTKFLYASTVDTVGKYLWRRALGQGYYVKSWNLTAGVHKLKLGHRHETVRVDQIIITNSSAKTLPVILPSSIFKKGKYEIKSPNLNFEVKPTLKNVDFSVYLQNQGDISIRIYSYNGSKIWEYSQKQAPAGINSVEWNKEIHNGEKVKSSVYFSVVSQGNERKVRKIIIM